MNDEITIRFAEPGDTEVIAEFNRAVALETENKELSIDGSIAGVAGLFNNPAFGFYAVAESDTEIIGALMVTSEWSDWRNGVFWWIQSVYVRPNSRRKGIYSRLYNFVRSAAEKEPGVCGFRLYVEKDNLSAQNTYTSLGMRETDYKVFEELKPNTRYCLKAV